MYWHPFVIVIKSEVRSNIYISTKSITDTNSNLKGEWIMEFLRKLWSEEEGQGMVEYGLIIALIAIVVIVAFPAVSGALTNLFNKIAGKL